MRLVTAVLALGLSASSSGGTARAQEADGTARMRQLLAKLADDADPRSNLYLNHERAELTRRELETVRDPETRARGLYLLAPELLLSGDTVGALAALNELDGLLAKQPDRAAKKLRQDIEELIGLAYLRLGEQQNCLAHGNADACLVPIRGSGIHTQTGGSSRAIAQFETILERRPTNITARWLLNLAYMTLGKYPDAVPTRWRVDEERFRSDHEIERFRDRAFGLGVAVEGLAGGVVLEDLDGDGDLDLMCSAWGLRDPLRIFENDAGRFVETDAGLEGITGGLNLVHADYDNDGRPDVLVLRGAWWGEDGRHPNSLLRNVSKSGSIRFEDVTHGAGLLSFHPTQTAAWADYDLDGWLDLFIGNESEPSELFRSNRDGTFAELSADVGISVDAHVKAVSWGDYDNDGDPDLYVSALGAPNRLFENDGNGSFENVAARAGVEEPVASFPAWFFDFDNDGWLDVFVSGYSVAHGPYGVDYMELEHQGEHPRLYRNRGDGTFANVTAKAGLDRLALTMGSGFGDLDGDGYLDIYLGTGEPDLRALVPNVMYRNDRGETFQDVTTSGGFGHLQKGHGVAFADLDHDGDQDIYAVMGGAYSGDVFRNVLFENPLGQSEASHHAVTLKLIGSRSNRDAIGARVRLDVTEGARRRSIHRSINTGGSFGSTSLRKTIGVGAATRVDRLEVRWPRRGTTRIFEDLPVGQLIVIREGSAAPDVRALVAIPFQEQARRVR